MSRTKTWCCTKNNFVLKQKVWRCAKSILVSTKTRWCSTKKCFMSTKKSWCCSKKYFISTKIRWLCIKKKFSQKLLIFSRTARHANLLKYLQHFPIKDKSQRLNVAHQVLSKTALTINMLDVFLLTKLFVNLIKPFCFVN